MNNVNGFCLSNFNQRVMYKFYFLNFMKLDVNLQKNINQKCINIVIFNEQWDKVIIILTTSEIKYNIPVPRMQ